ncbi:serine--tRNA ligase [Acidiluteibacter ferrifornacis]|uniref:Serine--tRNA ligase n=1 Tax=Acidiluteibacter ferrifornacis TaxID=2692424 RepID=A0A6N9NGP9_9FLAO|nr:serine--tRNA ligase [Acidiluteibacter ferrifornacis]NBG64711.1 serine--tRNA ligase [Acidiluteibacter ferrifornacis]
MLQIPFIKENKELIIDRYQKRNLDGAETLDKIIAADGKRIQTQQELDGQLAEANSLAKQIGDLFKSGKAAEANALKERSSELKASSSELKEQLAQTEEELKQLLYLLPNVPNEIVPEGKSDADNKIVSESGAVPNFNFEAAPHWDLAKKHDLIDFELGVKITGAGFPIYKGKGAILQRALINFFLDEAREAGYEEVIPPHLVNEASGYGTGQLPDKEGQMYHVGVDDLYLIPTAEVPVTNIYRDVILKESDFPIKNTAYTPCFRREAGSYGKDVRGLNRLHQFDKVEIVQIQHPDKSYEALDAMVNHVKGLLDKLGLPYRVALLCGGDLGFTSAITYDMEVFSAAQEKWLEVSSISNFETFQANRLKLRFKNKEGKTELAHTLNGSALALPRILAAILENYQTENGINIPEVLIPYTKFKTIGA